MCLIWSDVWTQFHEFLFEIIICRELFNKLSKKSTSPSLMTSWYSATRLGLPISFGVSLQKHFKIKLFKKNNFNFRRLKSKPIWSPSSNPLQKQRCLAMPQAERRVCGNWKLWEQGRRKWTPRWRVWSSTTLRRSRGFANNSRRTLSGSLYSVRDFVLCVTESKWLMGERLCFPCCSCWSGFLSALSPFIQCESLDGQRVDRQIVPDQAKRNDGQRGVVFTEKLSTFLLACFFAAEFVFSIFCICDCEWRLCE